MQISIILCVLIGIFLLPTEGEVVENFNKCIEFFYKEKVPDFGATNSDVVRICQRYRDKNHFATLYNTEYRTAVYSAYIFEPGNGGEKPRNWFLEPQLVNPTWSNEMLDGYKLSKDHPGIDLGERQALKEDYTNSGFDRGHLNPNWHHAALGGTSTFTMTNVVPQNPKMNQKVWHKHESNMTNMFIKEKCHRAYVLVGVISSSNNWIIKNNVKRVNIPEYIWNAYCCVDQNDRPIFSGAASANNTDLNVVVKHSLDDIVKFLQQYSDAPVGELFSGQCKA